MIGNTVKAQREAHGLSREQLAEAVGTSPEYIRHIEAGHRRPGFALGLKLAQVLEISPAELIGLPAPKELAQAG